jgi:hypothetical protein
MNGGTLHEMLTEFGSPRILPQGSNNFEGDGYMGGTVRCARRGCGKQMTGRVCQCGNSTCYVFVYHKGKSWTYRRDKQGDILTFGKALKLLNAIREQIDSRTFDPEARLDSRIVERRFENKWETFVEEKQERVRGGELSPSRVIYPCGCERRK